MGTDKAYNPGSSGTYSLGGSGNLVTGTIGAYSSEYIGYSGTATFTQSGGTNNIIGNGGIYLGYNAGSSGSYNLNGSGVLSAQTEEWFGVTGMGSFTQSGGTNSTKTLYLGCDAGSSGGYNLGGSGVLLATVENFGYAGSSTFTQTAGLNVAGCLLLSSSSRYQLSGGTLQVSSLSAQGVLDGTGGGGVLVATGSAVVDLSQATFVNTGSIALSIGPNSLLLLPAGLNPETTFGSYSNLGATHVAGTPLTILAGQSYTGAFTLTDSLNCQGTITAAANKWINLTNGFSISGTANVSLGYGGYYTGNDPISSISGGSLLANSGYVGFGGTGTINQSGGTSNVSSCLYLGNNAGSSGMYNLSGNGQISAFFAYVGYSGTGAFTQSGGTSSILNLYLGNNAGSSGTYCLSGNGQLSVGQVEYVGYSGTGAFTQTGGTNSINLYGGGHLYVGYNAGSSGTYNLSGSGLVSAPIEYVGGSFTQTGGTNSIIYYGSLYLGTNTGGSCTYNLSGSGLLSAVYENVGYDVGMGTFSQSGGTNSASGGLTVGTSGSYTLSGSGLLIASSEYVGSGGTGTGTFTQSGGTNTIKNLDLYLGYSAGSNGVYNLSGSGLLGVPVGFEYVGYSGGVGTFNQTGGTNNLSNLGVLYLGYQYSFNSVSGVYVYSSGSYSLSGSGLLSAVYENVGYDGGMGTFSQSGGTNSISGGVLSIGTNGSYTLSGSGLLSASAEWVGSSSGGTGTFTQSGGTNRIGTSGASSLYIGYSAGCNGVYNLSGSGLLVAPGTVGYVGYSGGVGTFNQTGGTSSLSTLYLGYRYGFSVVVQVSSSGSYSLSGPGLLSASSEYLGYEFGAGSITQSGGTNSVSNGLYIGDLGGGTYNLSGSGLLSANAEYIGYYGAATFTQSGGTNMVTSLFLGGGTYNLTGGVLLVPGIQGASQFNFGGGTLTASAPFSTSQAMTLTGSGSGATFDTAGYAVTLSGSLSGPGSLTKIDSGTLTLAVANTYSGTTLIGGGKLALGSPLALQNSTLDTSGSGVLSFGSLTAATFGGLTGPGTLGLANSSSRAVVLSVGNNNVSTTFSGMLQGPGSLNKIGSGAFVLNGSDSYTGGTTVSGGTLEIGGDGTTGSLVGKITDNTALVFNRSDNLTFGSTISGTGSLTQAGAGILTFTGDNTYTGGTMVDEGTLVLDSNTAIADGTSLTVGAGETSIFNASSGFGASGTPAAVPEPSALALLGIGAFCLLTYGWRRRKQIIA